MCNFLWNSWSRNTFRLGLHVDSSAEVDANLVLTEKGGISEIQISGEKSTFSKDQFIQMHHISEQASREIFKLQKKILEDE